MSMNLMLAASLALQMAPRAQRIVEWDTYQYQAMLKHFRAHQRRDFVFLNVGCGIGEITYRAIEDGIPESQTLSVDEKRNNWLLGCLGRYALGIAGSLPLDRLPFVAGDLCDTYFLPFLPHAAQSEAGDKHLPDLRNLKTLAPLHHRVSAIFAERLFPVRRARITRSAPCAAVEPKIRFNGFWAAARRHSVRSHRGRPRPECVRPFAGFLAQYVGCDVP